MTSTIDATATDAKIFLRAKWADATCEHCGNLNLSSSKLSIAAADFLCLTCDDCGLAKLIGTKAMESFFLPDLSIQNTATVQKSFGISSPYRSRDEIQYYNDTVNTDAWQREVYEYAARVMQEHSFKVVYDIGCGSAFKLLKYLGQYETCGFDVPETLRYLRATYPQRTWAESNLSERNHTPPDLVICSDVIEHVLNPDELTAFIKGLRAKLVIFSTPDRDLVYPEGDPFRLGPPRNETHVREWNFREFNGYISRTFPIVHHVITNREQATQMTLCLGLE